MRCALSGAGLMLGVIAAACAAPARADDLRTRNVLLESGVFLAHAETSASLARLDDARMATTTDANKALVYFESGSVGYGQADRDGRLGYGGDARQMRTGADRAIDANTIVGATATAGFGGLGSGDLGGRTIGRHAEAYVRFDEGQTFTKALVGGSLVDYRGLRRGPSGDQCRAETSAAILRAATQFGGKATIGGVTFAPTIDVAAYADALDGYRERSGADARTYAERTAFAALGSVQLRATRAFALPYGRKIEFESHVGAEDVLGFYATAIKARDVNGDRATMRQKGSPSGRGVFGGLGLGAALAEGVQVKLSYDYGLRDNIATHASRAKLGVSF